MLLVPFCGFILLFMDGEGQKRTLVAGDCKLNACWALVTRARFAGCGCCGLFFLPPLESINITKTALFSIIPRGGAR